MAGHPPNPPPAALATGSSSTPKLPPTLAAGSSSSPKPPPPSFTRHPSDEELMDLYLRPRIASGTKLEADFIHEADLYSADPDLLTSNPKYAAATASNGGRAWYFFTPLRPRGSSEKQIVRNVDTGREGKWVGDGFVKKVRSNDGAVMGKRRGFRFMEEVGDSLAKSGWRMMEFRLNTKPDPNPKERGEEAGSSSDLFALYKVYRSNRSAKAEGESSMAAAKADAEAPAASAVVTPGPKGADEEIDAETAAGPGRKRKAGDEDSGAKTVAASPGRQNKADGEIESAGAPTTGEIVADGKDPLDAAEKAEQDPLDPCDPYGPIDFSDYIDCHWLWDEP